MKIGGGEDPFLEKGVLSPSKPPSLPPKTFDLIESLFTGVRVSAERSVGDADRAPGGPGVSPGKSALSAFAVVSPAGREPPQAWECPSDHAESVNIVGTRDCLYPGVAAWCGDARENRAEAPLTVSGEAGGKEMKGETEHVSACAAP